MPINRHFRSCHEWIIQHIITNKYLKQVLEFRHARAFKGKTQHIILHPWRDNDCPYFSVIHSGIQRIEIAQVRCAASPPGWWQHITRLMLHCHAGLAPVNGNVSAPLFCHALPPSFNTTILPWKSTWCVDASIQSQQITCMIRSKTMYDKCDEQRTIGNV